MIGEELDFGEIVEKNKQPEYPVRALLVVPHKRGKLVVARDAFGSNSYLKNVQAMGQFYSYPNSWERISFEPLTTDESISVAVYEFPNRAKLNVFNPSWLQAGYVLRTADGVWANPLDFQGKPIQNESILKGSLEDCKRIEVKDGKHIYIGNNGFGFAEYGTFDLGIQSGDDFANGGLARILENTSDSTAKNLRVIADKSNYKLGVNVFGFDSVKEPIVRVVSLYSGRDVDGGRLVVDGSYWYVSSDGGYALGGLVSGEASEAKK
ncbi:MAG: hypothetical protein AABX07_02700 [Nanoarchaeota archaeon]